MIADTNCRFKSKRQIVEAYRMLEAVYVKTVRVIAVILTGYLFLQGLFTLCNIQRIEEKTFFIKNNPLTGILGILVFTALIKLLTRPGIWRFLQKYGQILTGICAVIFCGFMLWWITHTAFWYYGDMEKVYMCAGNLLAGDFSQWKPGGYAYMWPFQDGLILFVAGLLKFFDVNETYYIFPLINVLFTVITIWSVCRTWKILSEDGALIALQECFMICYLPYAFLSMLLYGNQIGYGFSALAVYLVVKYTHTGHLRNLVFSAVCMTLGICFKPNCLILLIGICGTLFLDIFISEYASKKQMLQKTLFMISFLILVPAAAGLPELYIEQVSGMDITGGNSKWAHVAMGLQESDMAPGWYNCYNENLFVQNHYDTDKTAEEAKLSIAESLRNFAKDPAYAWKFFNQKIASQWNNPTFECFHIQNSRNTAIELSGFVLSAINDGGKLNILLIYVLDILQSVLLFGILIYFLHTEDRDHRQFIWALLFIGAFVFWTFWEAKSRYVAPYFLFLIPYAFMGYRILADRFREKKIQLSLVILLLCIVFIGFSGSDPVKNSFKMDQDTEDYYEYIHQYNHNFMNLRY